MLSSFLHGSQSSESVVMLSPCLRGSQTSESVVMLSQCLRGSQTSESEVMLSQSSRGRLWQLFLSVVLAVNVTEAGPVKRFSLGEGPVGAVSGHVVQPLVGI